MLRSSSSRRNDRVRRTVRLGAQHVLARKCHGLGVGKWLRAAALLRVALVHGEALRIPERRLAHLGVAGEPLPLQAAVQRLHIAPVVVDDADALSKIRRHEAAVVTGHDDRAVVHAEAARPGRQPRGGRRRRRRGGREGGREREKARGDKARGDGHSTRSVRGSGLEGKAASRRSAAARHARARRGLRTAHLLDLRAGSALAGLAGLGAAAAHGRAPACQGPAWPGGVSSNQRPRSYQSRV